jgi:hypothetical protein
MISDLKEITPMLGGRLTTIYFSLLTAVFLSKSSFERRKNQSDLV